MPSRIDRFLFSVDWEDHFQGVHQVILPKITSDHFPILLQMKPTFVAKRPFKFENIWLEVDGFFDFVKSVWHDSNMLGSSSFLLAKKLNYLKFKLKAWNREVVGQLDTKLDVLIERIKVFDAKEQMQALTRPEKFERLEVKKELSLVRKWRDTIWRQRAKQH